jgi:diaminohydroxyphosphoribosylaminopyrimidine deaminase/5-amino-6-(5-phosphoribosylamino)uracil reductase
MSETGPARDEGLMRKALLLAAKGRGRVEPNPVVGAIVVRDGREVGHGWHARFGGPHAEPDALADAGQAAEGSTVYVSLEPCAHTGKKTPPCTDALIEAKVARVVIAAEDPNPATTGLGPRRLREAGIEVTTGVLANEASALNPRFPRWLESDRPFVIAKWAMTLDGKIADVERGSKYITGPDSRRLVHEIRGSVDAVAVGVGTVIADDPDLTVRDVDSTREPVRVILDSHLRTPLASRVVTGVDAMPTWIVTTTEASADKRDALEQAGCRVLSVDAESGHVDLAAAFRVLKAEGLSRILLEGGGEVHTSAFRAGIVDHVMAFIAPKLLGGRAAPGPLGGDGVRLIADPLPVVEWTQSRLGNDFLLEGFVDPEPRK